MATTLRLFFAIQISTEIRDALAKVIKNFQAQAWGHAIRWVHPENLHITLRFIGPCKEEQVLPLIENVSAVIKANSAVSPFVLQLSAVQLFPTPSRPRIISVGFFPNPRLFQLVYSIEEGIVSSGFSPETRPYLPHLTLGRFVQYKKLNPNELPLLDQYSFTVEKISLLKSEERDGKRIYEEIKKIEI